MKTLLFLFIFSFSCLCFSQDKIGSANSNSSLNKEENSRIEKWKVYQEDVSVNKALHVFKSKSAGNYDKKVWIADNQDGSKRVLLKYATSDSGETVVFSPDDDFAFYVGSSGSGETEVFGVNLLSGSEFAVGSGDDFNIVACPAGETYVVIKGNSGKPGYSIYTIKDQEADAINTEYTGSIDDIKRYVCY